MEGSLMFSFIKYLLVIVLIVLLGQAVPYIVSSLLMLGLLGCLILMPIVTFLMGYYLQSLIKGRKIKLWVPWLVFGLAGTGGIISNYGAGFSIASSLKIYLFCGAIALFMDIGIIVKQLLTGRASSPSPSPSPEPVQAEVKVCEPENAINTKSIDDELQALKKAMNR